jgi:hypothetical protein
VGPGNHPRSRLPLPALASLRVPHGLTAVLCSPSPGSRSGGGASEACVTLAANLPLLSAVVGLDHANLLRVAVQGKRRAHSA